MKVWYRVLAGAAIAVAAFFFFRALVGGNTVSLFDPAGPTAAAQTKLIETMVLLMLVIVVPMFILLFTFAWRYRADNPKAKYEPDKTGSLGKELMLWAIPAALIAVLGTMNWQSAHSLDPAQPITSASGETSLTVQVVALEWKWLFIYPQQGIATVNFLEIPAGTPVHFDLTADAPMSSFWIPQLGSQIYAMAAMMTQLNLEASTTGQYLGRDTEINGDGYAGMTFETDAVSQGDFNDWVAHVKQSPDTLDAATYNALVAPSTDVPSSTYASVQSGLFDDILMKYMEPSSTPGINTKTGASTMPGMSM